ncbi:MAG: aspartate--tRNA ligase [Mycoplasmataceae bacterium]|nr:aspartate--tRNA ligase [Mycoplasmataceae bacterium]
MKTISYLTTKNIGQKITINGWVKKTRRLGELIFLDLRQQNHLTQIVVNKKSSSYELALSLRSEDVISVVGKVVLRKSKNDKILTGHIEIFANEISLISKAKNPPLILEEKTDALEELRMEYRYLDLRRPNLNKMIRIRSQFNQLLRTHFLEESFIEIETPYITKPTIGGAGELKILSQNHPNKYYSLTQSPQIYKQLLMYGGFEKYFQIARCFRDEDSRADRQLEFSQLDLELTFTSEQEVKSYIESLFVKIFKQFLNQKLKTPFLNLSYETALNNYGSDKPDLRFDYQLIDLSAIFSKSVIPFFATKFNQKNINLDEKKVIKAVCFEQNLSNNLLKKIDQDLKQQKSSGMFVVKIENQKPINKNAGLLNDEELKQLLKLVNKKSFSCLIIVDEWKKSCEFTGKIRLSVAKDLDLIDEKKMSILWITDWPLFGLNENKDLESLHNPFSAIALKDQKSFAEMMNTNKLNYENVLKLKSQAYDLVLNGSEIGGGAIRINDRKQQEQIFHVLGISTSELEKAFAWFLKAQEFGIPQHGGIALGIDRILAVLFNVRSIRDVIAFPKSSSGIDNMMKAPITK